MKVIVVHGGAGAWPDDKLGKALDGLKEALKAGFSVLESGGRALDAVEETVANMEDNEVFNAGTGSALNLAGDVEAEASIMDGPSLAAGAVALIRNVKNPVRLARLVMEKTDHVLLVGQTAEKIAEAFGLEKAELKTKSKHEAWEKALAKLKSGEAKYFKRLPGLLKELPGLGPPGTVGALALDDQGRLAAATSTGGIMLKLPGRLGDTSQIGAGTYADECGACSATGIGEVAIRLGLARMACLFMRLGLGAKKAAEACMDLVAGRFPWAPMGVITLDARGEAGAAHTAEKMPWGYVSERTGGPRVFVRAPGQ